MCLPDLKTEEQIWRLSSCGGEQTKTADGRRSLCAQRPLPAYQPYRGRTARREKSWDSLTFPWVSTKPRGSLVRAPERNGKGSFNNPASLQALAVLIFER